jgi:glutaredoxin
MKEVAKKMEEIGRADFKTWPRIFHNGVFIGGFADLQKIEL